MIRTIKLFISVGIVALLLFNGLALAANIPAPPKYDIYLADYASLVTAEDKEEILKIGKDLDKRFGAQLVVLTMNKLGDEPIEAYANRIFRSWGIGDAKKNNGVIPLNKINEKTWNILLLKNLLIN